MLVCVVARAPGMWQNIREDHLISSTLRKLRGSSITRLDIEIYIYIYVYIYIHMYNTYIYIHIIRSEWVRSLCCHLALCQSSGSPGRCCEDDSHLWDYARGLDGTWWDKMGGDCLSHYHPLKCHWVGLKIVVPPNFDGLSFINVYHQGPHWSWQKSYINIYNKYS